LAINALSNHVLNAFHWFYHPQKEDEQDLYGELREAAGNCEQAIGAEAV
jgi:hypothetical protein